tara:strand:+ start:160 stop:1485 length:1326 start_codon:yes stop_codon:yes gene_type:complete
MFYIVEEDSKLQLIENLVRQGCYIDVVSSNDNYHPKLTSTVAVYLRFPKSKSGFIIPISHDEGVNVDKKRVYDILLQAPTLYTLDKKKLLYHFNLPRAIDISLLYSMVKYERLEYSKESNTLNYFYNKHKKLKGVNSFIPISKLYEVCENVYDKVAPVILLEIPAGFDFYNNTATSVFYLLEQEGLGVEYEEYVKLFTPREPQFNTLSNTVYTYYNLYNSTSRPTNAFNSVNYAAIPKTEAHRACFTPQNDFFVEFDFDGYHLRLLCEQIDYKLTPESAHKQLAKHYFGTEDISDEQYLEAKQINFQAIYGKIPKEHRNLDIFVLIQEYIDNMWAMYEENGVVYNPVSGKPFTKELQGMHPAKLMNYMMQSLETSRNILILKEVLKYLRNKKTTAVLFTYDAILFDYSKEDGKETLLGIQKVLEQDGKYPVKFKYSKDLVL